LQPVHTYIAGAHLFSAKSVPALGAEALAALNEHARDAATLARVLGLPPELARVVRSRVVAKLKQQPIEDYRLDFEDGYGIRPDAEEDAHARSVADELAVAIATGTAPPFTGIRIKPMSRELRRRSLRTLDLFVSTLARMTRRQIPDTFAITLTKVMEPAHVTMAERACSALERRHKLRKGTLKLEVMIETPQSVLAPDGRCRIPALIAAGRGRVRGALFGTYDYTTLCGISASWQHMRHAACDFAKEMMRVSLAQTGVWMSDGATNVMPVGPREAVHNDWKTQFDDIRHSLINGFYQGWDLHAAQLPIRFAAVYAFFLAARPAATTRLRSFVERASQATLLGDVFDDAATGQALLNFFVRGVRAGALTLDEARETGLSAEDLQGRSFLEILDSRR
jgi:citrate lyase beta subunit